MMVQKIASLIALLIEGCEKLSVCPKFTPQDPCTASHILVKINFTPCGSSNSQDEYWLVGWMSCPILSMLDKSVVVD